MAVFRFAAGEMQWENVKGCTLRFTAKSSAVPGRRFPLGRVGFWKDGVPMLILPGIGDGFRTPTLNSAPKSHHRVSDASTTRRRFRNLNPLCHHSALVPLPGSPFLLLSPPPSALDLDLNLCLSSPGSGHDSRPARLQESEHRNVILPGIWIMLEYSGTGQLFLARVGCPQIGCTVDDIQASNQGTPPATLSHAARQSNE